MSRFRARALLCLSIGVAVLLLDQLSKWVILDIIDLDMRQRIEVNSFFDLAMVWNRGVSFGLFNQKGLPPAVFILLSLGICGVLLYWLRSAQSRLFVFAIGLVVGGAVGNVIDRVRFGAVADFLYFHLGSYYWPAFNVADAAICIGVALLCVESMLTHKPTSSEPS